MAATASESMIGIGELSTETGVAIETIRYYEREGLLPRPVRSSGGRRLYTQSDARRLSFIRRCRELGFTLMDAQILAGLADTGDATCASVKAIVSKQLSDVRGKLADLHRLETSLAAMERSCPGSQSTDCPILEALSMKAQPTISEASG